MYLMRLYFLATVTLVLVLCPSICRGLLAPLHNLCPVNIERSTDTCCYRPNTFLKEHSKFTIPEAPISYTKTQIRKPCECKCHCLDDPECQAVTIVKPEVLKYIEDGYTCLFSNQTTARNKNALEKKTRATTYFKKGCSDVSCGENQECLDDSGTRAAACSCVDGHVQDGMVCAATCSEMNCSGDNQVCDDNDGTTSGVCTCEQGYIRKEGECLGEAVPTVAPSATTPASTTTTTTTATTTTATTKSTRSVQNTTCVDCEDQIKQATCSTMNCNYNNKICDDNGGTSEGVCICPPVSYVDVGNDCLPTCDLMLCSTSDNEQCEDNGGTTYGTCDCKTGYHRDAHNNCVDPNTTTTEEPTTTTTATTTTTSTKKLTTATKEPTAIAIEEPATTTTTTITKDPTTTTPNELTTTQPTTTTATRCGNFSIGDQQFMVLRNESKTWGESRKMCQEKGLDLAEPKDNKAVVDFLDEVCGLDNAWWIGGRGDDSQMVTISGTALDNNNPLFWFAPLPSWNYKKSECLYISSYAPKDTPLHVHSCADKKIPLCGYSPKLMEQRLPLKSSIQSKDFLNLGF